METLGPLCGAYTSGEGSQQPMAVVGSSRLVTDRNADHGGVRRRWAASATRIARAAAALEERGAAVTSRTLAEAARISREHRLNLAPAPRNRRNGD